MTIQQHPLYSVYSMLPPSKNGGHPKIILSLFILVFVVGLVGLYNQQQKILSFLTSMQQPKELIKLKTTLTKATASEPEILIIKKYELDKKNGLDIEFVPLDPGDTEREFFAGTFKIRVGGPLSSAAANNQAIPVKLLAPAINIPFHIVVPKNSSIKTLDDLKGKKFATLPKITASYASTTTILRSYGINPETDMQLVFVTPAQVVDLLEKGEVDAAIVSYPLLSGLLTNGKYRSLVNLADVWKRTEDGLSLPFVVIAAHEGWLLENKDTARRFIKTFQDAAALIQNDPSVLAGLTEYLQANNIDSPEAIALLQKELPSLLYTKWDQAGVEGIIRYYEKAKEYGVLPPETPSAEKLLIQPSELGF